MLVLGGACNRWSGWWGARRELGDGLGDVGLVVLVVLGFLFQS